jgi:hypothetical protein
MTIDGQKLFSLLPALYRLRDAQLAQAQNLAQGPLQALMTLLAEQFAAVEEDLEQLYDDQFIETCAPWVIPYIADLVGYQAITGATAVTARAEVAHTISVRRRKGTVLVLEQLARDVTGWGAHAVEFFQGLATTQYLNHIRPANFYAPDLRGWQALQYMNSAFDGTAHTVDVRRVAVERGRQNIQNIGIFLWSLNAYSQTMSPAAPVAADARCFRFSPLGADLPLFNLPVPQGADISAAALPVNVPDRMSRQVLCTDLQSGSGAAYYGLGKSVALYLDQKLISPASIQVCNLAGEDGQWSNLPAAGSPYTAAIDPELGRLAIRPPVLPNVKVAVSFYYGFNGDMGGGEYPRAASFTAGPDLPVAKVPAVGTIQAALDSLHGNGVVEITDSGVYAEPAGLSVQVRANGQIELRAADGCHPTLLVGQEISVTGGEESALDLNGICLAYARPALGAGLPLALVHVPGGPANQLSRLGLTHCTVVPGWVLSPREAPLYGNQPALVVEPSGLALVVQQSILGGLRVARLATASLSDSILDATAPGEVAYTGLDAAGTAAGGALTLTQCTVVGQVQATLLSLVSNSIVWAEPASSAAWESPPGQGHAPLWAERKQEGCVRYSFLPAGSATPGQFSCVTQAPASPAPAFVSLRYGDPGYGKLLASTDDSIRRGADDGGEMGAFHFVLAPLRESDLRTRMQEYLGVGLEYGIFYQT